ncbi:MAG TPA: hypothetical protein VF041_19770 [Gemmatimonadaceae bacterium]
MARTSTVLICAGEPLIAALLGMLAEMAQYDPIFPEPNERPEDALLRVRPPLVVLLEGTLEATRSDLFFAQAAKRRVGIALFGGRGSASVLAPIAVPHGIPWVELPTDPAEFRRVLDAAAESSWWRRGAERRRATRERRATQGEVRPPDGTPVYLDRDGARWFVYDRRSGERRRRERRGGPVAPEPAVRYFVREDGETRSCTVEDGELTDFTQAGLARQFARALRV